MRRTAMRATLGPTYRLSIEASSRGPSASLAPLRALLHAPWAGSELAAPLLAAPLPIAYPAAPFRNGWSRASMAEEELRGRILSQVAEYYEKVHARRAFEPGITKSIMPAASSTLKR